MINVEGEDRLFESYTINENIIKDNHLIEDKTTKDTMHKISFADTINS